MCTQEDGVVDALANLTLAGKSVVNQQNIDTLGDHFDFKYRFVTVDILSITGKILIHRKNASP